MEDIEELEERAVPKPEEQLADDRPGLPSELALDLLTVPTELGKVGGVLGGMGGPGGLAGPPINGLFIRHGGELGLKVELGTKSGGGYITGGWALKTALFSG